jgi:hypothetical protein
LRFNETVPAAVKEPGKMLVVLLLVVLLDVVRVGADVAVF